MRNRNLSRREVLKYSLTALLAMNFGCSIRELLKNDEYNVALIYGTKYGATGDTAAWIRSGMEQNTDLINIESMNFKEVLSDYDYLILGSGVWIDGVHQRIKEFLAAESPNLKDRVRATFVVCGSQDTTEGGRRRIQRYLEQFHGPLGYAPSLSRNFGGRVIVEQLTREDREALTVFYRKYLKQELESWDRTDRQKAFQYGGELSSIIERNEQRSPELSSSLR